MSPVSTGAANAFTFSLPISQNPNPNLPADGSCQSQSSCFSIGHKEPNGGLDFDFSKLGPNGLGQPRHRRIRPPVKRLRRKSGSEDKNCADKLFSETSKRPNEAGVRSTSTSSNLRDGDVGEEGGGAIGKSGKVCFTFDANVNGFASNLSNENEGFLLGTIRSSSTSNSSNGSGSFMFGVNKSRVELNFDIGNGGTVFGVEKSGSLSKLNPTNEKFVFGSDENSSMSNLSNGNVGFVFGADKSSFMMKSDMPNVSSVPRADASDLTCKSTFGNASFMFGSSKSNPSSNSRQMDSTETVGQLKADNLKKFGNVGSVFRAKKYEFASDSKSEQKGTNNRCAVHSGTNESSRFSDAGFVFGGNKTSMASEDRNPDKEDRSEGVLKAIPDMRGKMKLDASRVSENDGDTSFLFGTDWNHGVKNDNKGLVFGAKGNDSTSTTKFEKSNTIRYAGKSDSVAASNENVDITDEFQRTNSSGAFVFRYGGKEKLDSNGSNKDTDVKKQFDGKNFENGGGFVRLSNDAMTSNFKFVIGSSCSAGSAFYKIPLSKLFDEMKSLKIDGSNGSSGVHQVKSVGSNSCFFRDNVNCTQNSGHISRSARTGTSSWDQHKDANVDDATNSSKTNKADMTTTKICNQDMSEVGFNLKTGDSFGRSMKDNEDGATNITDSRSGVGVSCSARVFQKENQLLKSSEKFSGGSSSIPDQLNYNPDLSKVCFSSSFSSIATSHAERNSSSFEGPQTTQVENENSTFARTPVRDFTTSNLNEFNSNTTNLFTGFSKNLEFSANCASVKEKMLKKTRRKFRHRILAKHFPRQDNVSKEGSSPKNFESPGYVSPMDYSPYQDTAGGVPASSSNTVTTEKEEEDPSEIQRSDSNEGDKKSGDQDNMNFKDQNASYFKCTTSSSTNDGLSAIRRQYRKKYKLKVGFGSNGKTTASKADCSSSSVQFPAYASDSSHAKIHVQSGVTSKTHGKADGNMKQEPTESMTHGACEHWRIRGNQAYKVKDLCKAEEFYTKGINSANNNHVSAICIEPLLLCYSNRAATRVSLGRLREALEDCKSAASLDSSFLRVKIRAANCHLVLGELEEAKQYYNNCLESGHSVCLDRRFIIEAADGLQKAQKVAEYIFQSAELLQKRTSDAANRALAIILEALSISCYSEKLLEMKGEALLLLRRYDEVVKLCEQTLQNAEKNFAAYHVSNADDFECKNSVRLWRWCLMSRSYFHLGRLEVALDLIEKEEQLISVSEGSGSLNQESSISLADMIRDLLRRKKAGNEAFQSGKHIEAIEHYTAAITRRVESRPFAAICFCNRAAAYQALGQIVDAIADCSLSIALDGNYPKAVSRRATLHEMIRDYKQATNDLQRLISLLENQPQEKSQQSGKLEGSSGSNKKDLKQARRRLSIIEDKAKKETSLDLYLILGIKASDTEADIKKAYRKAALRHHPDKAGQFLARNDGGDDGRLWKDIVEKVHEDADRLFKMIGEAHAVLSDPDKRSKYNYEEEIRDFHSDGNKSTNSGRPSDFYNSPYERGNWSGRQSDFYSSRFERSRNRRHWQESWRSSYDDSHSRW